MSEGGQYPVRRRQHRFQGHMFDVVTDEVEFPDGQVAARDYLRHVGSVAVVPLFGEAGGGSAVEVVLVRQYRHPVGGQLWELPAGLVDGAGESLAEVAARELAEETDLVAEQLEHLLDLHLSPGCSNERIRIFQARGLTPAPRAYQREFEEAGLTVARFPLDEAVRMVLTGQVTNAAAAAGVLATSHTLSR